jgi:PPOX class probable F420-dependent enzyme
MKTEIPENFLDLMTGPVIAHLATIMADGGPHVTPVWFDYESGIIRINSARGRVKDRNMRNNPKVALSILDPKNPYRYIALRGRVAEITEEGAEEHIDRLAQKYMNVEKYPHRSAGEVRVMYRIAPEQIITLG